MTKKEPIICQCPYCERKLIASSEKLALYNYEVHKKHCKFRVKK